MATIHSSSNAQHDEFATQSSDAASTPAFEHSSPAITDHKADNPQIDPATTDLAPTTTDTTLVAIDSLELDKDFHPTHCFFITRHWGTTQRIPIYDISSGVDLSTYPKADNKEIKPWFEVAWAVSQQHLKSTDHSEQYAIQRANWYGNNFTLRSTATAENRQGEMLVDWKGGWYSGRKNRLLFPAGSPHSSHEVTMTADNYIKFREVFVVDSRRYEWHCLNRLSMRQFRCDMVLAGGAVKTVARMWQKRGVKEFFAEGGVLVLESADVDEVVLLCTAMVIQRKTRQKAYEYSQ